MKTVDDLAELLGVKRKTVLEWRKQHSWPSITVGRTIRFTDEQVDEILAKHTVRTKVAAGAGGPSLVIDGQTKASARRSS